MNAYVIVSEENEGAPRLDTDARSVYGVNISGSSSVNRVIRKMEHVVERLESTTQLSDTVIVRIPLMRDLDAAIEGLALAKGVSKAKIIERFLLENTTIAGYLRAVRNEPKDVPLVAPDRFEEHLKTH